VAVKNFALSADTSVGGIGLLYHRPGGTVFHTLFFELQNTGLTGNPTEFSMSKVANQSLRFRFGFMQFRIGSFLRVPG
jgi:hypothetical protein